MTQQECIETLCILQTEVNLHLGFETSSDCFCGTSGLHGTRNYKYLNDGQAIAFIQAATREKIEREKQATPGAIDGPRV